MQIFRKLQAKIDKWAQTIGKLKQTHARDINYIISIILHDMIETVDGRSMH
jgi:hypothetical protein